MLCLTHEYLFFFPNRAWCQVATVAVKGLKPHFERPGHIGSAVDCACNGGMPKVRRTLRGKQRDLTPNEGYFLANSKLNTYRLTVASFRAFVALLNYCGRNLFLYCPSNHKIDPVIAHYVLYRNPAMLLAVSFSCHPREHGRSAPRAG